MRGLLGQIVRIYPTDMCTLALIIISLSLTLPLVSEEKLDQLVKWLSPLHYNVKHEESVEKHQEDTGTWLFEKKIYKEWEDSTQSVLWIHGITGCGKTILA
jgi:predicted ATPase